MEHRTNFTYQESLSFLQDLAKFGVNPGLSRIRELLRRLGDPQKQLPHILHIGGTNGKGSTAACCESILRQAGYRTGFFSSPHLASHRERYRVDNQWIGEEDFAALVSRIAPEITAMVAQGWESPTEFELATACALLHFAQRGVDWAVLEVGMGGAIDSTNIADGHIAVLTNVALDHCAYLGDTVSQIARVKAGIIKPGATVISGVSGEALPVVADACQKQQAALQLLGRRILVQNPRVDEAGGTFDLFLPSGEYPGLRLNLPGFYQLENGALAVAACAAAGCPEQAIRQGLAQARWPGRLEVVCRRPLILLDGAHNPHGVAALVRSLEQLWPHRRRVGLLGMLADKERRQAVSLLAPALAAAIVTPPPYLSRQGDWQTLAEHCAACGLPAQAIADNRQALQAALAQTGSEDMLVITGSLYLIAAMRQLLTEEPALLQA